MEVFVFERERESMKKVLFFEIGKPGKVDGVSVKLVYHYYHFYQKNSNKLDIFYKRKKKERCSISIVVDTFHTKSGKSGTNFHMPHLV